MAAVALSVFEVIVFTVPLALATLSGLAVSTLSSFKFVRFLFLIGDCCVIFIRAVCFIFCRVGCYIFSRGSHFIFTRVVCCIFFSIGCIIFRVTRFMS